MPDDELVKYEPNAPARTRGTLKSLLNGPSFRAALAEVAPKHLTPERVVKMVLMATSRQPKLLECTQESLLKAAMTSTELGLDCSGTLGRGYLVPYRNNKTNRTEAIFIDGYLGKMDLARRSGEIQSISADVVYKQDLFSYEKGLREKLMHKPDVFSPKCDEDIKGAYMICRFKGGGHHIHFMSRHEIEKIRGLSKARDSGPWKSFYPEMCKKTVLRAGLKMCPLSVETQQALAKTDEEFELPSVTEEIEEATLTLDDVIPGDESDHTEVTEPLMAEVKQEDMLNEVKDAERKALLDTLIRACEKKGVKAKTRQNAAIADMCTQAAGVETIERVTTIDQLNACINWIGERFGEE